MTPAGKRRWASARRGAIVFAALVVVWAFTAASTGANGLFNAEKFTLQNGMDVVVIPNHRAPVVVHMVWYRVGAADEPHGKSGIAHFLEHLMFKGTGRFGPGEFSRLVAENGGNENAFTSADYTAYFQRVARDRLEVVMEIEADRMRNIVLTEEIIAPERAVVQEERNSRTDNDPGALFSEQLAAAQFLNHPYGNPIIGWRHEVEGLRVDDAIAFYNRHYWPNNATLIVAGDVTAEELRPLAEKYYGVIPTGDVPPRIRPSEPPQISPRRLTYADERVPQPTVTRTYLAPSYSAGENHHALPLQVLAEVLGGGTTSRLYQSVVVDQKLASWAGTSYGASAIDQTRYYVYAAALPNVDVAALEAALDAEIDRVTAEGISQEELDAAKSRMAASAVYALDNPQSIANIFGRALSSGLSIEDIESWPERISAVTREQVLEAARAVFVPARSVTGILLPKSDG